MITITHTHADGTLIEGSRKGDGVYELLKDLRDNWRWMPSIGQIGIGQSRDKVAQAWKISRAAEALRAAGFEVTTEIDETVRRDFAEAESERYERADDRAGRMTEHAANAARRSESAHQRAHEISDGIPFGQPILVGHHSEGRHRRDLDRIHKLHGKGFEEDRKADYFARRAESAAITRAARENIPATLRRIAKLEADERRLVRDIEGGSRGRHPYVYEVPAATGDHLERLTAGLADVREQLAYWREHVARRQADGVKVWSREDFRRGDFAQWQGRTWFEVLRVSAKSVTIPALIAGATVPVLRKADTSMDWTDTLAYDKITGRKSADEMAAFLVAAS